MLAIIKESAGLVEDLVQVHATRGSLDREKVHKALERIEHQVKRGADLLTTLNRLVHTLDQDLSKVDLSQEVEQLILLSQRFARLKNQQVEAEKGPEGCHLAVNDLHLHMILHGTMMRCLEELPQGSKVAVGVREEGGAALVEFRSAGGRNAPGPSPEVGGWPHLESLGEALGAKIQRCPTGYGIQILFSRNPGTREAPIGSKGQDTE